MSGSGPNYSIIPPRVPIADQLGRCTDLWWRFFSNLFTSATTFSIPIGAFIDFAAATPPPKWLLCDGSAVLRSSYPSLFDAIGTTWGAGDGRTTFNLPDFRGKMTLGAGGSHVLASTGGAETTVLSTANLPAHNHGVTDPHHTHTITDPTHTHTITDPQHDHGIPNAGDYAASGTLFVTSTPTGYAFGNINTATSPSATGVTNAASSTGVTNVAAATGITTQNTGSGTAVTTISPYAVATKIIYAGV